MALVTINNVGVISGVIAMPLNGVWTADLVIDQVDGTGFAAGTSVTIASSVPGGASLSLSGVVAPARSGSFLDAVHVRVLGGAGGMGKSTTPTAYAQPGAFVRDVVNRLMTDSSETLSSKADQGMLAGNLVAWSLILAPVSQALETLLRVVAPSSNWRFLSDGTLWIGQETWPTSNPTFDVIEQSPKDGSFELGVESPSIMPGVTLAGVGQVNRVEHHISGAQIRSRVWSNLSDLNRGIPSAMASLVRRAIPGIDYFTLYDAKVVSQSADLSTLDLQPTDARLAGYGRVPLKLGTPGVTAQVASGAIVRLGWNNGDPSNPYAALWDGGASVIALNLNATTIDIKATGNATLECSGTATVKGTGGTALGSNPAATPVLTVGSVDSLGVPVTNAPTNTGLVTAG